MGMIPAALTADELEAHAKGFGCRFDDYVDIDCPIMFTPEQYAQIVAWCDPYVARRYEVQGAVTFHLEADGFSERLMIERVYVMGGNSESFQTTCKMDSEEMLRQMREHYPDRTAFKTDQVGIWHLHPGYYPSLSVGDVEECRATMRDALSNRDTRVLQLLMYGHPSGTYSLSGYLVGLEEVNRLPVRIRDV